MRLESFLDIGRNLSALGTFVSRMSTICIVCADRADPDTSESHAPWRSEEWKASEQKLAIRGAIS
jgi:hypothetical protein